jgi:hypothetical protein
MPRRSLKASKPLSRLFSAPRRSGRSLSREGDLGGQHVQLGNQPGVELLFHGLEARP